MITKKDYENLIQILEKYNIPLEIDKWNDEDESRTICDKDKDFIIMVSNIEIYVSFHVSCLPNLAGFLIYIIMKHFNKKSKVFIYENHCWSNDKNKLIFGEEAKEEQKKETYINALNSLEYTKKLDFYFKNYNPNIREC